MLLMGQDATAPSLVAEREGMRGYGLVKDKGIDGNDRPLPSMEEALILPRYRCALTRIDWLPCQSAICSILFCCFLKKPNSVFNFTLLRFEKKEYMACRRLQRRMYLLSFLNKARRLCIKVGNSPLDAGQFIR